MKLKLFFSTALIVSVIATRAATENGADMTDTNAAAGAGASPQDAVTALFGDPVIAKGNDFQIKRSDLDSVLTGAKASAAASGQTLPPDFDAEILDRLIGIQILDHQATAADKIAGQHDADVQYTNIVKHFGSEEALERQLTAANMTVAELRSKATEEAVANATLRRELNVSTSDAEAREYYSNHPSDFEVPEMVHVQHILLLTIDPATHQPLPPDQIQAKHKQIEELLKRARAGEDFSKLASEYSEDPGSKNQGGELPPFPRGGQMAAEFEAAAFSTPTNQISDVVTTVWGFHIIKVLDKTPPKTETLDTVLDPDTHTTVMDGLKTALTRQKLVKLEPAFLRTLEKQDNVQIVDPTLASMMADLEAASTNAPAGASPQ